MTCLELTRIALIWPPRYCMAESAGFMCQTYYTTFMMICEHLRRNLGRNGAGGIYGCVMKINVGKA